MGTCSQAATSKTGVRFWVSQTYPAYSNRLSLMLELIRIAPSERGPVSADGFFGLSYENENRKRAGFQQFSRHWRTRGVRAALAAADASLSSTSNSIIGQTRI
jgi:hypothetical protein